MTVVRSLQSGLSNRHRRKRALFAGTAGNYGRNSLQSRLRGGGRGIRTPGTVSRTAVFKTARFNHSRIPPLKAWQPDLVVSLQQGALTSSASIRAVSN